MLMTDTTVAACREPAAAAAAAADYLPPELLFPRVMAAPSPEKDGRMRGDGREEGNIFAK